MAADAAVEQTDSDHPGYHEGDPILGEYKTPEKEARPWSLFKIDGHPVMVREPKNAYLLDVALRSVSSDEAEQLQAADDILFTVFDEDAREHLRDRLNDNDDDFDIDELGDVVVRLQEIWGKGHGGSAKNSPSSSRPRTKRSTARRR